METVLLLVIIALLLERSPAARAVAKDIQRKLRR